MPIITAVILGPLVAGLIVCLLAVSAHFFDHSGETIVDLVAVLWIYLVFAYVEGSPVALVAGLLVSIWMIWRPPGLMAVIGAAIAAIALCYVADRFGMFNPVGGPLVSNNLGIMLVFAIIVAGVCWLLTRRFVPAS